MSSSRLTQSTLNVTQAWQSVYKVKLLAWYALVRPHLLPVLGPAAHYCVKCNIHLCSLCMPKVHAILVLRIATPVGMAYNIPAVVGVRYIMGQGPY